MSKPGEIRRFKNGRSLIVLSWWNDQIEDEGTHWLCALIAEHKDPMFDLEVRMPNGRNAVQAWNFASLNDRLLDSGELVTTVSEPTRKSVSEVLFFGLTGKDDLSDETRKFMGKRLGDIEDARITRAYFEKEHAALQWIELQDKFWQDFWGVVPVRRYRKHSRKLPRVKRHIKHRRWEDDEWDGGLGD